MSIARASIQHKVATILASILICVFGLMFATQLQMALMPEMEMPMAVVACYYTGASPSDIEELVTRPLEGAIMSVPGVDTISSTSSDQGKGSRHQGQETGGVQHGKNCRRDHWKRSGK